MKTWRECCSPHGRYESPTRTAWRSEPSPSVKTEASSTRLPSSCTSPSLPTPTESTLNDTRQGCADDFVSSTCGTTEIDEWAGVVLEKLPHQLKKYWEKKTLCWVWERPVSEHSPEDTRKQIQRGKRPLEVNRRLGWNWLFIGLNPWNPHLSLSGLFNWKGFDILLCYFPLSPPDLFIDSRSTRLCSWKPKHQPLAQKVGFNPTREILTSLFIYI